MTLIHSIHLLFLCGKTDGLDFKRLEYKIDRAVFRMEFFFPVFQQLEAWDPTSLVFLSIASVP